MVVNKPAIIIYTDEPDEDLLREVCAGIEEEGVLYQVSSHEGDLDTLAFEAANIQFYTIPDTIDKENAE